MIDPSRTGTPKIGTRVNSEGPDDMSHESAFSSGTVLIAYKKSIFGERNAIFF